MQETDAKLKRWLKFGLFTMRVIATNSVEKNNLHSYTIRTYLHTGIISIRLSILLRAGNPVEPPGGLGGMLLLMCNCGYKGLDQS